MSSTQGGAAKARETPPESSSLSSSRPEQLTGTMPQPSVEEPPMPEELSRPAVDASGAGPADREVARRAYELYLARGGAHGFDMDDWIQAESELRALPSDQAREGE